MKFFHYCKKRLRLLDVIESTLFAEHQLMNKPKKGDSPVKATSSPGRNNHQGSATRIGNAKFST